MLYYFTLKQANGGYAYYLVGWISRIGLMIGLRGGDQQIKGAVEAGGRRRVRRSIYYDAIGRTRSGCIGNFGGQSGNSINRTGWVRSDPAIAVISCIRVVVIRTAGHCRRTSGTCAG